MTRLATIAKTASLPAELFPRRFLRGPWPFGFLAILTGVFFLPLLASSTSECIATPDIEEYFLWIHQYARDALLAGRVPLWNPYTYCGVPFAANPQCSVFYPLSWLYLLMPVVQAHKWMIALHVFLGGSFQYLFLRRAGIGPTAAMVACLPWMFGSYVMANASVGHLTMLFTMTWLPLSLYCCERALTTQRLSWLFWTGFVLGIQFIAGEAQNCYYTVLLVASYGLVRTAGMPSSGPDSRWSPRRYVRWAGRLAIIALVSALTAGIQLLPTAEFAANSDRAANTYEYATNRSFPPSALLGFLFPWRNEILRLGVITDSRILAADLNWEFAAYVGIFPLLLAGVSLGVRGQPALRASRFLFVLAFILMLGGQTPIYRLLYLGLPGLGMFRIPARAVVIAVWTISVMSAYGMEQLTAAPVAGRRTGRWERPAAILLILVAIGLVIPAVTVGFAQDVRAPSNWWRSEYQLTRPLDPIFVRPLFCILASLGVVLTLRRMWQRGAVTSVAALVALDLFISTPRFPLHAGSPAARTSTEILRDVRQAGETGVRPFRVDFACRHVIANAAMGAHVENVNGYWPFALQRLYHFAYRMRDMPTPRRERVELQDDLYIGNQPSPLRILNVRFSTAMSREGWNTTSTIVEDASPLPRVWVVDRAEVVADDAAALTRVCAPDFDPARAVILERAPRIAMAAADSPIGTCTATKHENGDLVVEAHTTRDGYLVLSEVFYPGWRATIDGRAVPPERADYLISALPLPAGSHTVVCRYRPLSVRLGAACTALSCMAAVVLAFFGRKRVSEDPSGRAASAAAQGT